MSNYVKATNFRIKDSLTTGDPNKRIKGAEIDDEFVALSTAISSKADSASPAFTGTPTAPTATPGNNSSQIATTAFVVNITGSLGTISQQNADAVAITGGTIGTSNAAAIGSNAHGTRTISSLAPTGGANGDIWYQY